MEIIEKVSDLKESDPLGVLLGLLEKEKLEISNFSLAKVADQYLEYLSNLKDQRKILENISEFLWVASKLALLKSKILLDSFEFSKEEIEEGDDLKERLIEYKKIKEVAEELRMEIEKGDELIARKNKKFMIREFSVNFDQTDLEKIFQKVVKNYDLEHVNLYQKKEIREVVKIEERIKQIKAILNKTRKFKFSSIIDKTSRLEVVVSFLSILELVKQGTVLVKQEKSFQDMNIIKKA